MATLQGMTAIADYMQRSPVTVLDLVRQYPTLPVRKIGGVWESDTESIDGWKKRFFEGKEPEIKPVPVVSEPEKRNNWKKKRR